jgi:hypothetical protein
MTAVTAAERILMGLGISDPKEIDLEAIAWSRGVLVEYRPLDGSRSATNWAIGIITKAASCSAAAMTSTTPRMTRSTPNAMQTSSHPISSCQAIFFVLA